MDDGSAPAELVDNPTCVMPDGSLSFFLPGGATETRKRRRRGLLQQPRDRESAVRPGALLSGYTAAVSGGGDLDGVDAPIRALFERVAASIRPQAPHLDAIAEALAELARDVEYLAPRIAELGVASRAQAMYAPARGPRLMLAHRREGQMGAVHDHGCWVAVTPIVGIETHRHWRVADGGPGPARGVARIRLVEERALAPAEVVALMTGDDFHDHGHVAGRGQPAYVLILTGDDQFRYRRTEWDLDTGLARTLEPGDRGRWLTTDTASRA